MNSQVHYSCQQGLFDFFCENTFATNLREWRIKDGIPRCLNDLDGNTTGWDCPFKLCFDPLGLPKR